MKHNLIKNTLLRGILCLLLCVVGPASAWGEEVTVTFDASIDISSEKTSMTKNGVTIKATVLNGTNNYYQTYKNENITISGTKISKIVFYCTKQGTAQYGPGCYTKPSVGSYSYSGSIGTWTGLADSITIRASSNQVRMEKITVTYEKESYTPTVESLIISGTASNISYYIGDKPSAEGLVVTATYNNQSTLDITSSVSWSFEPATILSNTTSVTATASYEEKSAQYTYNIINKGEKTFHDYTLDLSTNSCSSSTVQTVKWDAVVASMTLSKGEGTNNANHYLGGSGNKETRFYTGHVIEITPKTTIHNIVFTTATSEGNTFASILCNSTYTNATASKNGNTVTITPKDGNNAISLTLNSPCGCTAMTVHYLPVVSTLTDAGYATFCLPYNATVPEGLTAYTATDNGEFVKLTAKEGDKIAAGEGVVLKGNEGTYTFVAAEGSVSATEGNQMVGVTKDTVLTEADNAYMLTRKKDDNSIAFRLLKTNYTLGANKAYLKVDGSANTRELIPALWDDNVTGIENTAGSNITNIIYNLAGQKLTRAQKGIYIINGKLTVR